MPRQNARENQSTAATERPRRAWPLRILAALGRGLKAWLNSAPGCSACNSPFEDETRSHDQEPRD